MQAQGIESRAHHRHTLRTRGQLLFAGNAAIPVHTLDIGVGGMCVVCEMTLPSKIQGIIEFNMSVGHGQFEAMRVNIQVLHSIFCNKEDGFKVGLSFLKPSAELLKIIQQMV